MRKILYIPLVLILLSACASASKIEYRDREVVKYVASERHDTIIDKIHDSIYTNVYTKGDTVYNSIYKERTAYKDRIVIKNDTVTKDSIQILNKENTVIQKKIPNWCWFILVINLIICIFVGIKIYIKWKIKI